MADWRVARALDTLLAQLNAKAPKRNKASDGSIGDEDHANRSSDHNPWYGPGIVTARDFTHDPANGMDCQKLAERLVASRDPRIKYVIWNWRIWQGSWRAYSGPNGHASHLHLSVMNNSSCDDTRPWNLGITEEDDMPLTQDDVNRVADAVWNKQLEHLNPGPHDPATLPAGVWLPGANMGAWAAANRPLPTTGQPTAEQMDALAARLTANLGPALAAELGRRLAS
ncbi:MAG: hypothetical protein ABW224_17630 [Kibdelosporangium sp.]